MGRWQPGARGRLEQAALELYGERGFEQTTVAEIAARAGLTERTFFRHYGDKREVLFAGSATLLEVLVSAVVAAPATTAPIDAVAQALVAGGELIGQRRDHSRARQAVIDANVELQERELIKLASLADALAGALRGRGVGEPVASLAAQTGIAAFKVAFERWVAGPGEPGLAPSIQDAFDELKAMTNGR